MNSIGASSVIFEAFTPVFSSSAISITGTGVTDLVNVTETGYLASIAWNDNSTGTWAVEITIDGQTTVNVPVVIGGVKQAIASAFTMVSAGNFMWPFGNMRYTSSLRVAINCTAAGSGSVTIAMIRGKKI
jgi:hypothetical protein